MRQPGRHASQEPWEPAAESLPRGSAEATSYLNRLTRPRLLTFEEEIALSARVQNHDTRARDRLVEANMRLVIHIAKTYQNPLLPIEDLIQEGAIGLVMAAERFDPAKGCRFSTFATLWIKKSISGALNNKAKAIRLPPHISEALRKLERVRALLTREQGEEPTAEQIAARLEISAKSVQSLLQINQEPISLDMLVGDEEGATLASLLQDHTAVDPQDVILGREREHELNQLLSRLSSNERAILDKRTNSEKNQPRVAEASGEKRHISRERARQIEMQALRKMKTVAKHQDLCA